MEQIVYQEEPVLVRPTLIAGFEGWPNAGEVSSFALEQLIDMTEARQFASIGSEAFYQMTFNRPVAVIKKGRLIEVRPAANHFYYSRGAASGDLIFFHGVEPHLRWGAFVEILFSLAEKFGVSQIVTLGGTYDYVLHTYPPKVSALFDREDMKERVLRAGFDLSEYTGPTSLHTVILESAKKKRIRAISLWGHAPHYLQGRNVKVVYGMLRKLKDLLGMEIDLSDLKRAGDYFDEQVHQLVKEDPKLQEVVHKLQEVYQSTEEVSVSSGKPEGGREEKVVYIQAFLRRPGDGEKKEE
jgi:proteasome assembly chaperone (PAC2) family protein